MTTSFGYALQTGARRNAWCTKVDGLDIKLVCILDRDKEYKGLKKYLEKLEY
ncbi:hypothetical protein JXA85_01740 [Candidatus Woesearchaeota archaeon]|nr:hypothetical protein [Candidatus Woesearchaeota archaeon]